MCPFRAPAGPFAARALLTRRMLATQTPTRTVMFRNTVFSPVTPHRLDADAEAGSASSRHTNARASDPSRRLQVDADGATLNPPAARSLSSHSSARASGPKLFPARAFLVAGPPRVPEPGGS